MAIQKVEIRRIEVWHQPWAKNSQDSISMEKKLSTCHPRCRGSINRKITVQASPGKNETISPK
jgi:hypothetical protein